MKLNPVFKCLLCFFVMTALSGCGDGDDKVAMLSGKSPYSCRDLNMTKARGEQSVIINMIMITRELMGKSYTESTPIQIFYRDLVLKNPDYAIQHRKSIEQECSVAGDISLNDAASRALNNLYAELMAKPRWATCRSLNSGKINYGEINQEMLKPTAFVVGGDIASRVALVLSQSPKYGVDYVRQQIEDYCKLSPNTRIWDAIDASLADERKAEIDEYIRNRK